jgi:hypothetical protein
VIANANRAPLFLNDPKPLPVWMRTPAPVPPTPTVASSAPSSVSLANVKQRTSLTDLANTSLDTLLRSPQQQIPPNDSTPGLFRAPVTVNASTSAPPLLFARPSTPSASPPSTSTNNTVVEQQQSQQLKSGQLLHSLFSSKLAFSRDHSVPSSSSSATTTTIAAAAVAPISTSQSLPNVSASPSHSFSSLRPSSSSSSIPPAATTGASSSSSGLPLAFASLPTSAPPPAFVAPTNVTAHHTDATIDAVPSSKLFNTPSTRLTSAPPLPSTLAPSHRTSTTTTAITTRTEHKRTSIESTSSLSAIAAHRRPHITDATTKHDGDEEEEIDNGSDTDDTQDDDHHHDDGATVNQASPSTTRVTATVSPSHPTVSSSMGHPHNHHHGRSSSISSAPDFPIDGQRYQIQHDEHAASIAAAQARVDFLLKALASDSPQNRVDAATVLRELPPPLLQHTPGVIRGVLAVLPPIPGHTDPDSFTSICLDVISAASGAPDIHEAIPMLSSLLSHNHYRQHHHAAITALLACGTLGISHLLELCSEAQSSLDGLILTRLANHWSIQRGVLIPLLIEEIHHRDPVRREAAVVALGKLGARAALDALPILIKLLDMDDNNSNTKTTEGNVPSVSRRLVAWSLRAMGPQGERALIQILLSHPQSSVRTCAADALGYPSLPSSALRQQERYIQLNGLAGREFGVISK